VDAGDYELKNSDANYFVGISNNFLFIDNGTGPDARDIFIYDLSKRKEVYRLGYNKDIIGIKEGRYFEYWIGEPATKRQCPDSYDELKQGGNQPSIETVIRLDLKTFKTIPTKRTRCDVFQ